MKTLEQDLTHLLNRYSAEHASGTPDFILAKYLLKCLEAWNLATMTREHWYGRLPVVSDPNHVVQSSAMVDSSHADPSTPSDQSA